MTRFTLLLAFLMAAIPASPAPAGRHATFPIIPTAAGPAAFESRDPHAVTYFTDRGLSISLIDRASRRTWGLQWSIDGARPTTPRGAGSLGPVHEFLAGRTRTNLPSFSSVAYADLLDGVSLHIDKRSAGFKYTVHCDAGVDAASLRYRYDGVKTMERSADGLSLAMTTGIGPMREDGLVVRQDGKRIAARFTDVRHEGGLAWTYGIELGAHDASKPIEIDPTVTYAMLIGGSWVDGDGSIRVDGAGNAYVALYCGSADMTTVGGFDDTINNEDLFIMKLAADGTTVWSTYYGGSGVEQMPFTAIDAAGNVVVFSMTDSTDLPTVTPFQPAAGGGGWDCFILKIAASGDSLMWASYLAGSGLDNSSGNIVLDASGNAYVAGFTYSTNFPGLTTGFDWTKGGQSDGFVTKVTADGSLAWSSYIGGTADDDRCQGIAIDAAGNLYVCGSTTTGFPATTGAYDTTANGGMDGYAVKIDLAPLGVTWATVLGGAGDDFFYGIGVDGSGNVTVAGGTGSAAYPTVNAAQGALSGATDWAVTKIAADGASLVWSTFLGGPADDNARALTVDAAGNVYVGGLTSSTSWPGSSGGFQTTSGGGYDSVVAKLTPAGALSWSSFLGGSGADFLMNIDVNATGLYIEGWTMSSNFPVTTGDGAALGFADVFIVKVTVDPPPAPTLTVTPTDLTYTATQGGAAPASQNATVMNSGGGTLNWTASDDAAWLSASATSGALGAGQTQAVALSVNPSGMAPGIYTGTFTVTDGTTTKTVTAHLTVNAPPAVLTTTPSSLTFAGTAGAANPAAQTVTVGNAGGSPLSWTATDDAAWMSMTPASGSLAAGASTNASVAVDLAGLAPGSYNGVVTITDGATTKTVLVMLTVNAAPGVLVLSPTDLAFTATQGQPVPASQAVTVSNTGGSPINWGSGQNGAWILVSPASGVVAAGSAQTMNVAIDHAGLAAGTYVGSVQVSDGVTTQTVTVRLTVNAPAAPPTSGGGSDSSGKKGCGGSAGGNVSMAMGAVVLMGLLMLRRK